MHVHGTVARVDGGFYDSALFIELDVADSSMSFHESIPPVSEPES
jgi:hypothetical protein